MASCQMSFRNSISEDNLEINLTTRGFYISILTFLLDPLKFTL